MTCRVQEITGIDCTSDRLSLIHREDPRVSFAPVSADKPGICFVAAPLSAGFTYQQLREVRGAAERFPTHKVRVSTETVIALHRGADYALDK